MKPRLRWFVGVALLCLAAARAGTQEGPLRVIRADPAGEIETLDDADQIRIVFSDPMVPLGSVSDGRAPAWLRMTPAAPGSFYWSGTRTLVFSPDASSPLPYSTAFTVRIDPTATSVAGRRLAAPYELTFTTPTLRLERASWSRQTERFDSPFLIGLTFNQPVRMEDVLAHTRVTLAPHTWKTRPVPGARERAFWEANDPEGLAQFDRKVEAVARVASSDDPVAVRAAPGDDWSRHFDRAPGLVVLETVDPVPPGAWLQVVVDEQMPGAQGGEPHPRLSETLELPEALFLQHCNSCLDEPRAIGSLVFTTFVQRNALLDKVTVNDITRPDGARPVQRTHESSSSDSSPYIRGHSFEGLGFGPQGFMSRWEVRVPADVQAVDGQTLGYSYAGLSEKGHAGADLGFGGTVFEAGSGAFLPVIARNVTSFTEWLLPVSPASLMPAVLNIRELPLARAARLSGVSLTTPPSGVGSLVTLRGDPDIVQRHPRSIEPLLRNGTGLLWATLLKPGTIEGSRPVLLSDLRSAIVQVTNLGITVKHGPLSTLLFVTRLDTGLPVDGATVAIVDANNHTRWTSRTGTDGIAVAPAMDLGEDDRPAVRYIVTAEQDGDLAFVPSTWNHEGPWSRQGGWYDGRADRTLRGSVFTDRGVYKQGDRVQIKAVLRDDTRTGLVLLRPGTAVRVAVTDPEGLHVETRDVRVSRWSSVEWSWLVPADAPLGEYRVQVARDELSASDLRQSTDAYFLVSAYRTPELRVDAALSAASAVRGEPLRATIDARYLFGGSVGERPVSWTVVASAWGTPPEAIRNRYPADRYDVGYRPSYTDIDADEPQSGRGVLDRDGHVSFAVQPGVLADATYRYDLVTGVEAVSGQHISGFGSLTVSPASLYLALSRPPAFVNARDGASITVAAVDLDGHTVPGVQVELELLRTDMVYVEGVRPVQQETPSGSWSLVTTGGETPVRISFPRTGSYVLRATARDAAGRPTRTESTFWGVGPERPAWRTDEGRLDLLPERTWWKPGETARILVQSPWERATALLTVEREGVRRHETFAITSMQHTVDVPITETDIPNVFVSVVLVKGRTGEPRPADGSDPGRPAFRVGYTELEVDSARKALSVMVSMSRDAYRPGDRASAAVQVTDEAGRPAESEVTFWAVDAGVLSLTGYVLPDVLRELYQPKGVEVVTGDSRQHLLMSLEPSSLDTTPPRYPVVPVQLAPTDVITVNARQGVSFEPDGPGFSRERTRTDFRPLAFWLGSVTTGRDGRAQTTIRLPDSLTTYRVMAVAGDRESRFGTGQIEIRTATPLALLPALPRFLRTGDRASFGATVAYSGRSPIDAVVTIESRDPDTLQLGAPTSRRIRLEPGVSQLVTFDAIARNAGDARVRMTVRAGSESDAFELPIPVTSAQRIETTAAYGIVSGTPAREALAIPAGARTDQGGLTVELSPTALVGLGESARYVTDYRHDGAEQRASKALVYLLASRLDDAFRLSSVPASEYLARAGAELRALRAYQCGGAFALFPGTCATSSPHLTAWVLHVLLVARSMGITVYDDAMTNEAIVHLESQIQQRPPLTRHQSRQWDLSTAYTIKVLAEAGRPVAVDQVPAFTLVEELPAFALSYLADSLHAMRDHGPRYQDLVRRITNSMRISADRAHVEEDDDYASSWMWLDTAASTAVVLEGLSRRGDAPELAAPLVRFLLAARTNGHWGHTHANARALEALVAYYLAHEAEAPAMTAVTAIGTARVARTTFRRRSTASREIVVPMRDLMRRLLAEPSPALTITRDGAGPLHYTARITAAVPEASTPEDRGFHVERTYERFTPGARGTPITTFAAGDVVRVRVRVVLRGEGRYLALTDPLPAGFEAIDEHFETTGASLAREATQVDDGYAWWRGGGFEHVEKHDDRVLAYATRLRSGTHEFAYLVRAMTAGTFSASGATIEAMYAPEWTGRSAAETIVVQPR